MNRKLSIMARGLARIAISPTNDHEVVALALSDTAGTATAYLVNPEGLQALLLQAIGLAAQWADKPDLQSEGLFHRDSALPAHAIGILPGRNDREIALCIQVGKIELTFLVPLDAMIKATAEMVRNIEPISTH